MVIAIIRRASGRRGGRGRRVRGGGGPPFLLLRHLQRGSVTGDRRRRDFFSGHLGGEIERVPDSPSPN